MYNSSEEPICSLNLQNCSFVKSLKELQELYFSILSAIPHALVGLKDRTIFFANEGVERVFGWKPEEIIGLKTRIFYQSDEDYEKIASLFYPVLERQRTHIEEFPCIRKDGKKILCRISASVIGEKLQDYGVVVVYEDITKDKEIADTLKKSEQKYRELVQNANSIILRWNSKGEITFLNEFGQSFFGYSEEELLGKHLVGTIVPETETTARGIKQLVEKVASNPKAFEHNINENMKRDGSRVWIEWRNKAVFDKDGHIKEILSIGSDITERKRMEEELDRYRFHLEELVRERTKQLENVRWELEQSNIKLKEVDRLKSMFIASMSHELRTPLNSIIGFTGLTLHELSGPLNEEQKDNLSRVYQSAKHLLALVTDIIDISRIEAGKIDSFAEIFSLKELLEEAITTVQSLLKNKQLSLLVDMPFDIKLNTDKRRLLQCLINLLSNAIKYTEKGEITVAVNQKVSYVELSVTDTGIGIDQKDISRIFEPFERIDTHLRIKAGGTGLGLYLTKKIVTEILRGNISVKSKKEQGSTFILKIPMDLHSVIKN